MVFSAFKILLSSIALLADCQNMITSVQRFRAVFSKCSTAAAQPSALMHAILAITASMSISADLYIDISAIKFGYFLVVRLLRFRKEQFAPGPLSSVENYTLNTFSSNKKEH